MYTLLLALESYYGETDINLFPPYRAFVASCDVMWNLRLAASLSLLGYLVSRHNAYRFLPYLILGSINEANLYKPMMTANALRYHLS
jgi:hypothetical protein